MLEARATPRSFHLTHALDHRLYRPNGSAIHMEYRRTTFGEMECWAAAGDSVVSGNGLFNVGVLNINLEVVLFSRS